MAAIDNQMRRFIPIALVAFACGPTSKTIATPTTAPPARTDQWGKLSFEERHATMTFTVLPNMASTWRDFKKTDYPEMTCRTCHGKDAESVQYRMPNPSLAHIDAAHPPAGPVAEFMRAKMVPDMIALLETTPEHLSCNTCHPK